MKKINIKIMLDDGEIAALAAMAKAIKMSVNEYAVVCMRVCHAKLVSDFEEALKASKEQTDASI